VAAYTFRDERDLLWYSTVFSAAEREGAYVIASSSCQAIHSAHTRSALGAADEEMRLRGF
jgi:hypothetical protein